MINTSFSIKVYDLSFLACNEYIENLVGNTLGWVEEVDVIPSEVEWGKLMRIRVTIDVPKPLLRKKKLNISLPTQVWVQFKYERLPNFCFCCGVLNHSHKECKTWMAALKVYEKERLLYGNSLWASFNGGIGVASKQRTPMQLKPSSSPVFPMTPN